MSKQNMSFQLGITFEDVEVKGIKIDLKNFLCLNARICKEIENLCRYNSYVNFAETLINGIQIEGKIETVFNHKRFIAALKKFQLVHENNWKGFFTYEDTKDNFIFKAPDFMQELARPFSIECSLYE